MLRAPGWESLITWYFFLGGVAGGAYFTAAIADNFGSVRDRRVAQIGYLLSLPLVAACGVLLILDLGVPLRFLNMLRTFKFWDPMSIGAWALGVFGLFSFVSSVLSFSSSAERIALRRKVGLVGTLFGFFLASYTGVLLGATALPPWRDGRVLGALFLASGASTGMAAVSLILLLTGTGAGEGWNKIKRADRFALVIETVLLALFLAILGSAAQPIVAGHHAALFWGGLVVIGLAVPLVIEFVLHGRRVLGAVSAALVLVGGFVLRYVILTSVHT